MIHKVLILGYPYVRKEFFDTFNFYPEPDKIFFLLPKSWKAKGGKVNFYPPDESNVFKTKAFFYHSSYPIIGGILKGWMPAVPFFLWYLKRKKGITMVYNCNEPVLLTSLYNSIWSKIFGLKSVVASWENVPFEKKFRGLSKRFKEFILKLNLFFCDGLVVGNRKGTSIYRSFTSKPIAVIPLNGINHVFFKPEQKTGKRKFRGVDLGDGLVFAFIGAIGYRKGVHLIIDAFHQLLSESPEARLIIAGSGEYETEVEKQIEKFNLKNSISRFSWLEHEEVRKLLAVSDIFIYPSLVYAGWEEQFGYSMAEASLMELPVISTRSGSIGDVIVDGETGLLVDENSVAELLEAMRKLAYNKDLRQSMGKRGRSFIIENFDSRVIARKFAVFFNSIT